MIKLSILIPVYNVEKYIGACFESIRKQNILEDTEIIMINDGSTDSSGDLCEEFAKQCKNVRYYTNEKNMGISYTRNRLIGSARGKYISWVDSDDVLDDKWYEYIYRTIELDDDIIIFNLCSFKNKPKRERVYRKYNVISPRVFIKLLSIEVDVQSHLCSKVLKKSLWEGIEFPKDSSYCEDFIVMSQLALRIKSVGVLNNNLYHYRKREGSIVRNVQNSVNNDELYFKIANKRYHLFKKNGWDISRAGTQVAVLKLLYNMNSCRVKKYKYIIKYFRNNFWRLLTQSGVGKKNRIRTILIAIKLLYYKLTERKYA